MTKSTIKKTEQGKLYRALVPYAYEQKGKKKSGWTEVGVGFTSKDGLGVNIELRPGLSVSGRIVLRNWDTNVEAPPQETPRKFIHNFNATDKDDLI